MDGFGFKGYKSFKEYVEIEEVEKINIFIGRNNSGKSSCIDIVEDLTSAQSLANNKFLKEGLDIQVIHELSEQQVQYVFSKNAYEGGIAGRSHYEFGKNYIGKKMRFFVSTERRGIAHSVETFKYEYIPDESVFEKQYNSFWEKFARRGVNYWEDCEFRRLDAERNIVAEVESDTEEVNVNGEGASNLVRKIINYSEYDEKLVQEKLLNALNSIIYPDAKFDDIKIQQISSKENSKWEIYLQEDGKRYALSKMGSGLKTIILVLINLLIIPELKKKYNKKFVFAFEELENNLHPALQRRLFEFIYDYAIENEVIIFLTTHSHVAINTFCDKYGTQIFHVEKKNGISTIHKISDYISKTALLNDLDVRASDILQSNGIIWVEGPSDRVYIKHWLEILGSGDIEEGRDYQFLYYGGRLLSHYTTEKECDDLINILLTNRNAAIVIDSDKRNPRARINDTKKRIQNEFKKYNAFCWITKGKEIENYIEKTAIEKTFGKKLSAQCEQFQLFPDYIKPVCKTFNKVEFARKVIGNIEKETACKMLDLEKQIISLDKVIKKWNEK